MEDGLAHRREERKHRPSTRDRDDRSRSPYRSHHDKNHKRRRTESPKQKPPPKILPFRQQPLSKHDFDKYKELFGLYLDVQKGLDFADLEEKEVRGRWKSFIKRWNMGELSEGWYEPATKQRADENASFGSKATPKRGVRASPDYGVLGPTANDGEESDDEIGPALPAQRIVDKRAGPTVPNMEELQLAEELRAEDAALARGDLSYSRKQDRKTQKELLEELVPRADPGSRERQLEKKKQIASTVSAFRDAKESGDVEVPEGDLIGDDGGIDGFKKRKTEMERKKNERELRREEQLRARMAEREERLSKAREKEDKTIDYLKNLVKERYG